jgi:hypothetical protein
MRQEQKLTSSFDIQACLEDRNGREFLPDWLSLWHGLRAGDQQGLHPDDLAYASEAETALAPGTD